MPDLTPDRSLRRPPPSGALGAVAAAGRRRRAAALSGGALALALLVAVPVGLAVSAGGVDRLVEEGSPAAPGATTPAPAAPCPATLSTSGTAGEAQVPAPPPEALEGALVPAEPPLAVSICRYGDAAPFSQPDGEPPEEVGLEGERALESGLERIPGDLALPAGTSPGVCTLVGGPIVPYLVQLRYDASTVWLFTRSDFNSCELVTNGAFTSAVYVGGQVEASYDAGAWVPPPPPRAGGGETPCPTTPSGRAGQETTLVPDGWTELVVCRTGGGTQTATTVDGDAAREAAALLNALPTRPGEGFSASCDDRLQVEGADEDDQLTLRFAYPTGRGVTVIPFVGCDPPLGNGSLSADATAEQQAELLRLLKGD